MKLYNKTGATAISSPEHGEFSADESGGVVVPEELGNFLHSLHINGLRVWENEGERHDRLVAEELARRSAPDFLASLVEELSAQVAAQSAATTKRPYNKKSDIVTVEESTTI